MSFDEDIRMNETHKIVKAIEEQIDELSNYAGFSSKNTYFICSQCGFVGFQHHLGYDIFFNSAINSDKFGSDFWRDDPTCGEVMLRHVLL
jgi:ribosomal protein L32